VTPTQLALHEGVKIQSLTRLLAELEADDWLIRVPHATDGRQSLLSLTPTGRRRLTEAAQEQDIRLAQLIQTMLSAEDRSVLLRACALMEGLSEVLGSA
jgi:DNA-binding MarR family transcriptional regulator